MACSYILSDIPLVFLISFLDLNGFALINDVIAPLVKPETYFKIDGEAVLILTPTSLTIFDTVKSKFSDNAF